MFQQGQPSGTGGGWGSGRGVRPPPQINTSAANAAVPTSSMRQGRFLSPASANAPSPQRAPSPHMPSPQRYGGTPSPQRYGGGGHPGYHHRPQQQQYPMQFQQQQRQPQPQYAQGYPAQQPQQSPSRHAYGAGQHSIDPAPPGNPLSPTSTVRFQEEEDFEEEEEGAHSPSFLFEEGEISRASDEEGAEEEAVEEDGGGDDRGEERGPRPRPLPSEAQLALLCLDHLRDLRRSYPRKQDLRDAEGLDADYVALAAWSLSRAFVRPAKLRHDDPRVTVETSGEGRRREETSVYGGGGLSSDWRDEAAGNDPGYRRLDEDGSIFDKEREKHGRDDKFARQKAKRHVALSSAVSLPPMEDITDEVLLRRRGERRDGTDDVPEYERDDAHPSNAHRFYLLDGLASSGGGPSSAEGGPATPRGLTPRHGADADENEGGGEPLSLGEVASAGLACLGARSRVDAEASLVRDPLFRQFVKAAAAGGFFQEKRGGSAGKSTPVEDAEELTPDEERRKSRAAYEEKYRKVVTKFRTKLAAKEAAAKGGTTPRAGGRWDPQSSPYHRSSPSRMGSAYRILSGNASVGGGSVSSPGGGGGGSSVVDAAEVGERLRRRRERRLERAREERRSAPGLPIDMEEREFDDDEGGEGNEEERGGRRSPAASRSPVRSPVRSPAEGREGRRSTVATTTPPRRKSPVARSPARTSPVAMTTPPRRNSPVARSSPVAKSPARSPARTSPPESSPSRAKEEATASASPVHEAKGASAAAAAAASNLPHYREAERLSSEGNALMQKRSFRAALMAYAAALELAPAGPNSHVYYSNRSAAHLSLDQHEKAIEDGEKAVALRPGYAKAHSRLGLAYFGTGRYEEAVAAYERALEIDPDSEWSRSHLEKARQKTREAALEEERAVKEAEEEKWAREMEAAAATTTEEEALASSPKEEEDEEAGEGFEPASPTFTENTWPTPFDGADATEAKEETKKEEDKAAQDSPFDEGDADEESAWSTPFDHKASMEATGYDDEEEDKKKREEEAIEEQTRRADEHKDRGNAHMSSKEYEQALHQYDLAIQISPSGPNSHVYFSNRAAARCYLADYVAASDDCRRSAELNPLYEKAHARLGLSLFFRGDYDGAVVAYERSLELDPSNRASLSYLKKARARRKERLREEERERQERKRKEKEENSRKRNEWLERQRELRERQQRQASGGGTPLGGAVIAEGEEGEEDEEDSSVGDATGITSTGLTSIVTNEHEEEVEGVLGAAPMQQRQQAFDPFVTSEH
ncbi:hypothetical protein ACHAWF_013470 [Thalassiosira exigua]